MNTYEIQIRKSGKGNWSIECINRLDNGINHVTGEFKIANWEELDGLADDPKQSKDYGERLGKALFDDVISRDFAAAVSKSNHEQPLRVLLYIEAEELKALRWEKLCAPNENKEWFFLRLEKRLTFSIYVPSPIDISRFSPISRHNLRALILVASPKNIKELPCFDVKGTVEDIKKVLQGIDCDVLANDDNTSESNAPTLLNLLDRLGSKQEPYTLLHIVCHGLLDFYNTDTILYWAKADGQVERVFGKDLIRELKEKVRSLPHFTFLCSCNTASPKQSKSRAIGGLAGKLVRELGMPAVVAMTDNAEIKTATELAEKFYSHLMKESGDVDLALAKAVPLGADAHDIIVPALFSRLGGLPLFSNSLEKELNDDDIKRGLERLFEVKHNEENEIPDDSEDELDNQTSDNLGLSRKVKYASLIQKHAPILKGKFETAKEELEKTLGYEAGGRRDKVKCIQKEALKPLQELCKRVFSSQVLNKPLECTFNDLALGDRIPEYDARCPFRGLLSFNAKSKEFFFGREREIEELEQKLNKSNFLAVMGASGSGKSSIVRAGLVPKLLEGKVGESEIYLTPGEKPLDSLKAKLEKNSQPTVLVVDQFEELFTLSDKSQRQPFINRLLELIEKKQQVVVTLRIDFWGECANYGPRFQELIQNNQFLIQRMTSDQLRTAMEKQAEKVGLRFEAGLGELIWREVEGETGAMPLLQHALRELWKRRHGRWLLCSEYEKIGTDKVSGLKGAIAMTANDFYTKLGKEDEGKEKQYHFKNIFLRLTRIDDDITTDEGKPRYLRNRAKLNEFLVDQPGSTKGTEDDRLIIEGLVERLAGVEARLVVKSVEGNGDVMVEVAHEALLNHWDTLKGWLEDEHSNLRLRNDIRKEAERWRREGRKEDDLMRAGLRLNDAIDLFNKPGYLNDDEADYIKACQEKRDRQEQEKLEANLDLNISSSQLLFASNNRLDAIVNMIKTGETLQKELEKYEPLKSRFLTTLSKFLEEVAEYNSFDSRYSYVTDISSNPKYEIIAASFLDRKVRFWSWDGTYIGEKDAGESVYTIAFSPNGDILACAGSSGMVTLWHRTEDHIGTLGDQQLLCWQPPEKLGEDNGVVHSLSFNPQNETLASAGEDGIIRIWNLSENPFTSRLLEAEPENKKLSAILHLAHSRDGRKLAAAYRDKTIIVWDLESNNYIQILGEYEHKILALNFDRDSKSLITCSEDKYIKLWNLDRLKTDDPESVVLGFMDQDVLYVDFTPNDEIVAACGDGKIALLSEDLQEVAKYLEGHRSRVIKFDFISDNKLVSCSEDKTIKFWSYTEGKNNMSIPILEDQSLEAFLSKARNQVADYLKLNPEI
jgi:WD40 repeat protein/energy-coupling factor transporter ATP-binding protein EcfA2